MLKTVMMQVNRKGDEVAQMATDYSALEIAYFKAVARLSTPPLVNTISDLPLFLSSPAGTNHAGTERVFLRLVSRSPP